MWEGQKKHSSQSSSENNLNFRSQLPISTPSEQSPTIPSSFHPSPITALCSFALSNASLNFPANSNAQSSVLHRISFWPPIPKLLLCQHSVAVRSSRAVGIADSPRRTHNAYALGLSTSGASCGPDTAQSLSGRLLSLSQTSLSSSKKAWFVSRSSSFSDPGFLRSSWSSVVRRCCQGHDDRLLLMPPNST